jgi:hypothetical protein
MEAMDWAIDRIKAEPKNEWNAPRRSQKKEISELKTLRAEIAKSGKPVKSRGTFRMVTSDR